MTNLFIKEEAEQVAKTMYGIDSFIYVPVHVCNVIHHGYPTRYFFVESRDENGEFIAYV